MSVRKERFKVERGRDRQVENIFLGLPAYCRAFFTQFRKINVS